MEWFILSRDMHVLCNPSLDAPGSLPIDDSGNNGQEISIVNNVAIGTYDFSVIASHKDSEFITEGNYVAFKDKYDKTRLYTIMSISGEDTWNVHCEDVGLDLINESATTWDYTNSPKTVEETLNPVLSDTGWVIGVNEIKEKRVATKYTSNTETWLTRIGQIMLDFDAECDFEIQMKGNTVTKQVVNIYKIIGEDKTSQRFVDNVNLISLSKEGSIEDLCTCLKCYGNEQDGERVTIADIEYDDGRYYSPSGHVRIYDREARKKWTRFRAYNYNGQGEFDGYINGIFEYSTTDPQVLFDKGLEELKKRSEKTVSYEVELYKLQADIGDSVQIADNIYAEKLYLSARVQSVKNHYSSNEEDTGVLENFKRLFSNPSDATTALIEQLKNQIVSVTGTEVFYQVGDSSTIPPTGEWSTNVVDVQEGKFLWTKTIFHYSDGSSTTAYSISAKGEDGESGKTSYIHIAYANSADGTKDFSLTESENKLYIGQYTDYIEESSTDPSDYAWTRIKGENGNDGVSLYTWIKYADTPTTGMSDNPDGKQYMGIAYNKTSPEESTRYEDYTWSRITGEGIPGAPGEDGKTLYTWVRYADDSQGTGISDNPTGKNYIGLAYNKETPTESNDPSDYTWSLFRGPQGVPGNPGENGRSYVIESSVPEIKVSGDGFTPDRVTFNIYFYDGSGDRQDLDVFAVADQFIDGEWVQSWTWTTKSNVKTIFTSVIDQAAEFVRLTVYNTRSDGVFSDKLAEYTLPITFNTFSAPGTYTSDTAPTQPFEGMLWKNTGTSGGYIQNAIYQWNGSEWTLYYFAAANLDVKKLSALTSDMGELTAGSIEVPWEYTDNPQYIISGTTKFSKSDGGTNPISIEFFMTNKETSQIDASGFANFDYNGVVIEIDYTNGAQRRMHLTNSSLRFNDENNIATFDFDDILKLKSGAESWQTLPLSTGYVASEGNIPMMRKVPVYGSSIYRVELKGQVEKSDGTNVHGTIANLPEGYRPSGTVIRMQADDTFKGCRVAVVNTGAVQSRTANDSKYVSLDGFSFDIE